MLEPDLIQIAGVHDEAEAQLLLDCGVRYLGFPLRLPVHAPDLNEERAAAIIRGLRPPVFGVVITYLAEAQAIVDFCHEMGARIVQLHGDVVREELARLKQLDPALTVIKSLVVGLHDDARLEAMAAELAPHVDAFISDTFDPQTGASGATGKMHDWAVSRRLAETSPRPVILAGGLTPDNVRQAILQVQPAGVDAHTGVEGADGRKCRAKVEQFVAEAKAGFEEIKREMK